jgi:hypothetical protein
VGLGGEVDDRIERADLVDVLSDRDVAAAAVDLPGQVRRVAGVGELVEHHDVLAGCEHPLDEVRADEPRTPGHEKAHGATV